jgi:anti-sigma B factor antagonist
LDLKDLEYMSSAGIKVLISTLKTCKRWNRGDLRLANVPPRISDVFDLAGLTPLFKVYPNAVEAVGSF